MKRKLLSILLLSISVNVVAQELPAIKHELESRMFVAVSADFFDKKLSVSFSPEIRFNGAFKYDKTLFNLGVDYDVMDLFKIGVGGRLILNKTKKGTKEQGRFDVDISRNFALGKFRLKPRIRYSNYIEANSSKSDILRYRLKLGYKHKKKTAFEPEVGIELFHKLESSLISSIRYSLGGDLRLNKHNYIGIQYMIEPESKTRIATHIIEAGYKFKF